MEGTESTVSFGVRARPDGLGFDFHAWVELDGRVLNDRPSINQDFRPLVRPNLLPPDARLV